MANDSRQGCTSPSERETMQSILEDTHPWPNWSFVDEAASHWRACLACQNDFPDGESRLADLRRNLEQTTRDEISSFRKSYLAVKHAAGVEDKEGAQCNALARLAAAGNFLSEQLWSVNTSGVPFMEFCPLLAATDIDDDEGSLVLIGALDFFMTLSKKDQDFVAAATAAHQLFDRSSALMEEARRLTVDEEDSQKRCFRIYAHVIANSPISPGSMSTILELGAPNIVQEYLRVTRSHVAQHDRKEATLSAKGDSLSRTAIDELGRELMHNFDDFSDSMKATQMEVLHRLEQWGSSPDPDTHIVGALGSELFSKLAPVTKRLLRTSEMNYRSPRTSCDEQCSTMALALAYENEFNVRIRQPLTKALQEEGYEDFPPQREEKLIQNRKPNKLTPGKLLRLVANNKHVRELLRGLGLDPEQVKATGYPVIELRNRVMHGDLRTEDIQVARDLILKRDCGAFLALIPH
jgi:hypothetical protein